MVGALMISQNMVASSANGDYRVMASQLASEKVEQIIADKTFQGYNALLDANYPAETMSGEFVKFTRTTSIVEVSTTDFSTPQPGSGMKKITVTVSWSHQGTKSVNVVTLLSQYS